MDEDRAHRGTRARTIGAAVAGVRPRLARGWDVAAWRARAGAALAAALTEEAARGRPMLWLPVAVIGGIVLFFAADTDPSPLASGLLFGVLAASAIAVRRRPLAFPVLVGAAGIAAGILVCVVRVWMVAAPILPRTVYGEAAGVVETVEPGPRSVRVVLRPERLARVPTDALPRRLRVRLRGHPAVVAGDRIAVDTVWHPPPQPSVPGGYDFARDAFFAGLGGVGQITSKVRMLPATPLGWASRFEDAVDHLRNAITARILKVVPGPRGAVGASMVAGERAGIPESMNADMRTAGIYHVISISGLHMALVAGGVFWTLRLLLVLVPGFTLRHKVKKWAALAGLAASAGYLVLSGDEVATQRSFIMIALVLLAVVADRAALTLRNVALSALLVLALTPEAAIGPSFQMSFAAVVALVAWYERRRARPPAPATTPLGRIWHWLVGHFGGAAVTTLLAGFATAPSAAFHFQRLSVYGLAANVGALPLISFVIMPAVVIGMVLMPFGLDAPAWWVMAYGVDGMIAVAHFIAGWPGASRHVVAFGAGAMVLMLLGLLWLSLFITRLRWLGLVPALLGLWIAAGAQRPDIYIGPDGGAAAVRGPDWRLHVIGVRFASFATDQWLAADGDARTHRDRSVAAGVFCDSYGCTAPLTDGHRLALDWTYAALRADCGRAEVVVTRLAMPAGCQGPDTVIDGSELAARGAITLTFTPGGTVVRGARPPTSSRRWYNRPVPPSPVPGFAAPSPARSEGRADDQDRDPGELEPSDME